MDYFERAKKFRAKKKFGQNFLVNGSVVESIIENANISPEDTILEIGPGLGFVTEQLAERAKKVITVEIDTDAIKEIKKLPFENIEIIENDILKTDITSLCEGQIKVVANIPYYITSPIIVHLLGELYDNEHATRNKVTEIILMVQKEVAERIVATNTSPSKAYGMLSVLCNFRTKTSLIQIVKARSFFPAPKVDSALVKFEVQHEPMYNCKDTKMLYRVVKSCFGTRRKNIKNALKNGGFAEDKIMTALSMANIDPLSRGESLPIQGFCDLADAFKEIL